MSTSTLVSQTVKAQKRNPNERVALLIDGKIVHLTPRLWPELQFRRDGAIRLRYVYPSADGGGRLRP